MSRDVMKLALEALESCGAGHISDGGNQWHDEKLVDKAITALREALAEQPARPYRQLQDNGSKYFGESWDKAEQPAQDVSLIDEGKTTLDKMADNAKELGLDYEPATYAFKTTSAPVFAFNTKPNYNITFHNQDGKQIGVLNFNGPEMTFVGDADESAKVFFDWIAESFKERLEQERADEREACAKLCEEVGQHNIVTLCAAAIRRGNT